MNLSVPLLQQRLFASLEAQYTSPVQTLAGNTVSGYPVVNAALLGHALSKHLDLSASVYNLFDKKYFNPGRPEDVQDFIQQDGRNFRSQTHGQVLNLTPHTSHEHRSWLRRPHPRTARAIGFIVLAFQLIALGSGRTPPKIR